MKALTSIFLIIITLIGLSAKEPFRGRLYDYKGKPIKNARVFVHDPKIYVKTDKEGKFFIDSVQPNDTIYVKWKGSIYDIPVDSNRGISVKFGRDYPKRRDYVDTGKGRIDARSYNGPHTARTAEQLEATGASDLISAMRGMSGVSLYYDKDKKRNLISIRNSHWPPLWIVDGVEMTDFPGLTVMEVERVEVLLDGGMYGTRGGGGVIIVTTKGSGF